jgi:alpha-tubulin suppressor-like RCC1 family protein
VGVVAGSNHTCSLHADSTVRCWGKNVLGQVGHNGGYDDPTVTYAYFNSSYLYRRGDQTLDFDYTSLPVPRRVMKLVGKNVVALTSHMESTCAQLSDGTALCWGKANGGGTQWIVAPDDSSVVYGPGSPATIGFVWPHSIYIGNGQYQGNIVALAPATNHNCALVAEGASGMTVRCWNENSMGQIGDGHLGTAYQRGWAEYPRATLNGANNAGTRCNAYSLVAGSDVNSGPF